MLKTLTEYEVIVENYTLYDCLNECRGVQNLLSTIIS